MGGFWSDISKTSTGKKRSSLDQARMQLLQQLLAAELNASAFGSLAEQRVVRGLGGGVLRHEQRRAIKNAQQQAASFNSQGDSATVHPGHVRRQQERAGDCKPGLLGCASLVQN